MKIVSVYVRDVHIPLLNKMMDYADKNDISLSKAVWRAVEYFLTNQKKEELKWKIN